MSADLDARWRALGSPLVRIIGGGVGKISGWVAYPNDGTERRFAGDTEAGALLASLEVA